MGPLFLNLVTTVLEGQFSEAFSQLRDMMHQYPPSSSNLNETLHLDFCSFLFVQPGQEEVALNLAKSLRHHQNRVLKHQ